MIDVGEKWAIVLGVDCVLSRETEKITKEQRRKVDELEDDLAQQIATMVRGKSRITFPKHPNVSKVDDQLRVGFTEPQIQAMISPIPHEAQVEYMAVARRCFEFLAAAFPRNTIPGLISPIKVPTSEYDFYRFYGLYRIIDDPTYVLQLICHAVMMVEQMQALRSVFPSFAAFIDEQVQRAFEEELVKDPNFKLPMKVDIGLHDWKGVKIVAKPYQLAYQDAAKTMGVPPPSKSRPPESASSLSAAQSALFQGVNGKAQ